MTDIRIAEITTIGDTERRYAPVGDPTPLFDGMEPLLVPGEEMSHTTSVQGPPKTVFMQRCFFPGCDWWASEHVYTPSDKVDALRAWADSRQMLALRYRDHLWTAHNRAEIDDPRLSDGKVVAVPVPVEEGDPGFSLCEFCGNTHEIWKGCPSEIGTISGVAR